jgi:hypothetical protein
MKLGGSLGTAMLNFFSFHFLHMRRIVLFLFWAYFNLICCIILHISFKCQKLSRDCWVVKKWRIFTCTGIDVEICWVREEKTLYCKLWNKEGTNFHFNFVVKLGNIKNYSFTISILVTQPLPKTANWQFGWSPRWQSRYEFLLQYRGKGRQY